MMPKSEKPHLTAMRSAAIGAVLTALLADHVPAAAQRKPSFDCAKAASVAEKAICAGR
jgi:uncharacterized protein